MVAEHPINIVDLIRVWATNRKIPVDTRTDILILSVLLSSLVLGGFNPILGQRRGFQPEDYYKIVTVDDVSVSPPGDLVAFTVTTIIEDENRRQREIWMQSLENGLPAGDAYRFTDPTEDSHSPIWSPDGSLLSFTSKRGKDENSTWFVRVTAKGGEAFHIDGVRGDPVWSQDGQWIAYLSSPENLSVGEKEGWVAPDAISNNVNPERFDGRVITSSRYKSDGTLTFLPHPSVKDVEDLYLVSANGGVSRQLTDLPFDKSSVTWSSDGNVLFFTGDELQNDENNKNLTQDIWVVRVTDGSVAKITANPGSERSPSPSPEGRRLAFHYMSERLGHRDIMVVDIGSDGRFKSSPVNLTVNWDLDPGSPQWTADGTGILFEASTGGNRHLFRVPASGGPVTQVTRGERRLSSISFSERGHIMAYVATDAVNPTELFIARGDGTGERQATMLNQYWMSDVALVTPEHITWTVSDSVKIEGWVIKPVNYYSTPDTLHQPGPKYPLILKIHGGPHGAYGNTFFPTFHVLSASGFFVLYSNPRGSSGYGHDFKYSTRGQWGIMDSEDFLSGVDSVLAKYRDVDPMRLGVSGGSYGGYMTNWLTATSDRFHAAVTSRSIANWESWWGSSDAQELTRQEFYGQPWERRDLYRRLSPISYVENVTAPTLIIHSEQDFRTPIGDGEQWFMSLKKLGVPVEMVRYPRSSHGLSRTGEPWLLVDRLERIRSWFHYWLVNERSAVKLN